MGGGEPNKIGSAGMTEHWGALVQPLIQRESNKCYAFWVRVFVALSTQRKMRMRHSYLSPRYLYNTFPNRLINGRIFEQNVYDFKICVLNFSTNFVRNISNYEKKWGRYDHKFILVFM